MNELHFKQIAVAPGDPSESPWLYGLTDSGFVYCYDETERGWVLLSMKCRPEELR